MVLEIENMRSTRRRDRGFTLLELMTALAVAGVLIAVGVPQLRDLTIAQRITGAAQDLHIDFGVGAKRGSHARDECHGLPEHRHGHLHR